MYLFLITGLLTIIIFRIINKQIPAPIFGVYQSPGKWFYLKVAFMFTILKIRKVLNLLSSNKKQISSEIKVESSAAAGYGIKSKTNPAAMDCRQPLSDHLKAIDAVYFNLASKDGWNLVVGTAIRPQGVVNGFLYLRVPGIGVLTTPKLPDTMMFSDEDADSALYSAEGITLKPFTPMRTWRIQYTGKMKSDNDEVLDVALDAVWSSNLSEFDFDTDMDAMSVACSMAREPWSREYFQTVQDFHQTHYEQHGDLNGTVVIDNKELKLSMQGVRDHSYGRRREWKNFHRYALHFITLEDGSRVSVGIVCVPVAFSQMVIGYMYLTDGSLIPVQSCDLELYLHGEDGSPPLDYAFSFQAGCKRYMVEVQVEASSAFYVGWEWEARVVENLARFRVNGVAGWGATEWEYRNTSGRSQKYADQDPAWTHALNKG